MYISIYKGMVIGNHLIHIFQGMREMTAEEKEKEQSMYVQ